jgi:hypothetical protein
MLISPNNMKQAEEGNMVGDMGIKAKQITHMMRVMMAQIASQPIGLVATNHVMDSQDKYQPDKIPGGKMLEFASSVIVQMNKYLLKEDEDGKALAGGQVAGIRSTAVVRKSRYAKPFERIKLDIPYDQGMNPYSGLFELFEKKGVIQKDGMRYTYESPVTGECFKEYRKDYRKKASSTRSWKSGRTGKVTMCQVGVDLTLSDEVEIDQMNESDLLYRDLGIHEGLSGLGQHQRCGERTRHGIPQSGCRDSRNSKKPPTSVQP